MVSVFSHHHPWSYFVISKYSPYELEDVLDDIYDLIEFSYFTSYNDMRMLETAQRIYAYGCGHGSVFRRILPGMMIVDMMPPMHIVQERIIQTTTAPPPVIVQQPAPQAPQIVIQQTPTPAPQIVYLSAVGQAAVHQIVAPPAVQMIMSSSTTQIKRSGEIERVKKVKVKIKHEYEMKKQRREVEELRQRLDREEEEREKMARERELKRQNETRIERKDERRDERRIERRDDGRGEHRDDHQDNRRDDRRDKRRDERRNDYRDDRRDDGKGERRIDYRDDRRDNHRDDHRDNRKDDRGNERRDEPRDWQPTRINNDRRDDRQATRLDSRPKSPPIDLYWNLGLSESHKPSDAAIKDAYKSCSLQHHPDRVLHKTDQQREHSAQRMREINQAKAILIDDPERKQAYDEDHVVKEHHFIEWRKRRGAVEMYRAGGSRGR
jgi:hypothetical protein